MYSLNAGVVASVALLAVGISAGEGRAEQKLCVNSSTGATRVIEAPERCRKVETSVVIPVVTEGETVKSSSYFIRNATGHGVSLNTVDNAAKLDIYCYIKQATWFALDPTMVAGNAQTFNDISGQPFQAFNDLVYNGGAMDAANVSTRPWAGVFTYRNKNNLSRFEVTLSETNKNGDCLLTVFAVGLGGVTVYKP